MGTVCLVRCAPAVGELMKTNFFPHKDETSAPTCIFDVGKKTPKKTTPKEGHKIEIVPGPRHRLTFRAGSHERGSSSCVPYTIDVNLAYSTFRTISNPTPGPGLAPSYPSLTDSASSRLGQLLRGGEE